MSIDKFFKTLKTNETTKPKPTTVSIIGSAGREDDAAKMSAALFLKMTKEADRVIKEDFGLFPENVCLVSGGSSWSDHVAVALYLEGSYAALTLHLPSEWLSVESKYDNKGRRLNELHSQFSDETKTNTLDEIQKAKDRGAHFFIHDGFFKRNDEVAKSSKLIAFSWGTEGHPISKGTAYTWRKASKARRVHVSLSLL